MDPTVKWILSGAGTVLGAPTTAVDRPSLPHAYAVYIGLFAPLRTSSAIVGPLADFVEVLRQNEKDTLYSDEDWIAFFDPITGDVDSARDLWDALLCQPSFIV